MLNGKQKTPELEFKKYSVVYKQTLLQSLVKVGRGKGGKRLVVGG